jgi:hypothetical protein
LAKRGEGRFTEAYVFFIMDSFVKPLKRCAKRLYQGWLEKTREGQTMKSFLSYMGGKSLLADEILMRP